MMFENGQQKKPASIVKHLQSMEEHFIHGTGTDCAATLATESARKKKNKYFNIRMSCFECSKLIVDDHETNRTA